MEKERTTEDATGASPRLAQHTWQRRKRARPAEILNAALSVFAKKGFASATMANIAERAGITKGTIYLYFQNKEELFKALVCEQISSLALATDLAACSNEPPLEVLRNYFDAVAAAALTDDALALQKVVIAEAGNFPNLVSFWREVMVDRTLNLFSQVIARGIRDGVIRSADPAILGKLCLAPFFLHLAWYAAFGRSDEESLEYLSCLSAQREVIMQGLSHSATAAGNRAL